MTSRVLLVCTANVCRSPMAAAFLRHHLASVDADVVVTSAGTRAVHLEVDQHAVAALERRGLDISGHRPRRIDDDIVGDDGADLIVTMSRDNLRDLAVSHPRAFARTFTLREIVRRSSVARLPPVLGHDHQQLFTSWVQQIASGRRPNDLLGSDPADDIADPYGRGFPAVSRSADDIDTLTKLLARSAPWPLLDSSPSTS
jgi:protein-tyrosine phosphatase